jgi:hypothetical protein
VKNTNTRVGTTRASAEGINDFHNIKKVAIPTRAHPVLTRFPKVEELACYQASHDDPAPKSICISLRKHRVEGGNGEAVSDLKSLSVIAESSSVDLTNGTYTPPYLPFPVALVWAPELIRTSVADVVERCPMIRKFSLPMVNCVLPLAILIPIDNTFLFSPR